MREPASIYFPLPLERLHRFFCDRHNGFVRLGNLTAGNRMLQYTQVRATTFGHYIDAPGKSRPVRMEVETRTEHMHARVI